MGEDEFIDALLLEHVGVKGMKWGVRRERRRQVYQRGGIKVREGGSIASKIRTGAMLGPIDLIRGRGIVGGARRKSTRVAGQLERFDKGKATGLDLVKRYGSTRVSDLVPVREKNVGKTRSHKADIAVVTAVGALFALNLIARQAQRRAI
jgi:hypothetical protein